MAPEYALHGLLSVKSDVFSFGVLVLEIVSGRKNQNSRLGPEMSDLLSYVSSNHTIHRFGFAQTCIIFNNLISITQRSLLIFM